MSTPEHKLLLDTPINDVTLSRVAEIFDEQQLQYRLETRKDQNGNDAEILRSGFSNVAIAMQLRGDVLIIDSVWRGSVPASEGPRLLMVCNQWNAENFAPTLRFFEQSEKALAVSAVREMRVAEGMTRNQLGAFVMSTLDSVLQSLAWIEQNYPQLVTWNEHGEETSAESR